MGRWTNQVLKNNARCDAIRDAEEGQTFSPIGFADRKRRLREARQRSMEGLREHARQFASQRGYGQIGGPQVIPEVEPDLGDSLTGPGDGNTTGVLAPKVPVADGAREPPNNDGALQSLLAEDPPAFFNGSTEAAVTCFKTSLISPAAPADVYARSALAMCVIPTWTNTRAPAAGEEQARNSGRHHSAVAVILCASQPPAGRPPALSLPRAIPNTIFSQWHFKTALTRAQIKD